MYHEHHRKPVKNSGNAKKKQSPNKLTDTPPVLHQWFTLQKTLGNIAVQRLVKQREEQDDNNNAPDSEHIATNSLLPEHILRQSIDEQIKYIEMEIDSLRQRTGPIHSRVDRSKNE